MGKPIKESISEVEKCAWVSEYYADNRYIFLNDEVVNTDARKSVIKAEEEACRLFLWLLQQLG
jgi:hypothetical protein